MRKQGQFMAIQLQPKYSYLRESLRSNGTAVIATRKPGRRRYVTNRSVRKMNKVSDEFLP